MRRKEDCIEPPMHFDLTVWTNIAHQALSTRQYAPIESV